MNYVRTQIAPKTMSEFAERQVFERELGLPWPTTAVAKEKWMKYISYELHTKFNVAGAKVLYERALLEMDSDMALWLDYVEFIQRQLKDVSLARAKFQ